MKKEEISMRVAAAIGRCATICAILVGVVGTLGCDSAPREVVYDVNLLTNGSFEEVGKDGLPAGWSFIVFRGVGDDVEVRYKVDTDQVKDGQRSWRFSADPSTRRFLVLQQEIEIPQVERVRLSGWMQLEAVQRAAEQFAQCNFLLTFYDKNHHRFQEMRFADKRTHVTIGTRPWEKIDQDFRVPDGTRYVAVQCILAMDGTAWFDDISLTIPEPINWSTASTKNFLFHWMPGHPFPQGAMASQQQLFDLFEGKLGLDSDVVVKYYFYPDTTTIRKKLSLKGHQYVSWDDVEFHSINANDNHEVIHFMTDPIGRPPRAFAEGTVLWLHNDWRGFPIHTAASVHVRAGNLTPLRVLISYQSFVRADGNYTLPSIGSFVGYVAERWGSKRLMDLYAAINGINDYEAFSRAFEKTYEIPLDTAEGAWRDWLLTVDISDVPRAGEDE